jgi:cytochrome c553
MFGAIELHAGKYRKQGSRFLLEFAPIQVSPYCDNIMLLSRLLIAVAATVLLLPAQAQDAKRGEAQAAMCIGCHGIPGYRASFPEVYNVPKISGQNAGYIVAALTAYAKGERKHPSMRGIAGTLTEQDMKDLGAFYAEHGGKPTPTPETVPAPTAEVAALLTKGACISCHGANFNKPISEAYPKLAGQPADYLYVALRSYQQQKQVTWGRDNAIMANQVKDWKPSELKAVAKYLSSLPTELKTVPQSRLR